MSKKGTPPEDGQLFSAADWATLSKDGLTEPLASALETIAQALRTNIAAGRGVEDAPSRRRPVTIRSRSRGLNLTLVISAKPDA